MDATGMYADTQVSREIAPKDFYATLTCGNRDLCVEDGLREESLHIAFMNLNNNPTRDYYLALSMLS